MSLDNEKVTDEELALKTQSGDDCAVNELLNRYRRVVNGIARKFFVIGGDTEDLAQVGLIAVYNAAGTFKSGMNFKSYAQTCVKNAITSLVRKSNSFKNKPLANYLSLSGENIDSFKMELAAPSVQNPEAEVINVESKAELEEKIFGALSALEYEIYGYYLEGYSYQEISQKIGKDAKAVDNAVQRIRKKIIGIIK